MGDQLNDYSILSGFLSSILPNALHPVVCAGIEPAYISAYINSNDAADHSLTYLMTTAGIEPA